MMEIYNILKVASLAYIVASAYPLKMLYAQHLQWSDDSLLVMLLTCPSCLAFWFAFIAFLNLPLAGLTAVTALVLTKIIDRI